MGSGLRLALGACILLPCCHAPTPSALPPLVCGGGGSAVLIARYDVFDAEGRVTERKVEGWPLDPCAPPSLVTAREDELYLLTYPVPLGRTGLRRTREQRPRICTHDLSDCEGLPIGAEPAEAGAPLPCPERAYRGTVADGVHWAEVEATAEILSLLSVYPYDASICQNAEGSCLALRAGQCGAPGPVWVCGACQEEHWVQPELPAAPLPPQAPAPAAPRCAPGWSVVPTPHCAELQDGCAPPPGLTASSTCGLGISPELAARSCAPLCAGCGEAGGWPDPLPAGPLLFAREGGTGDGSSAAQATTLANALAMAARRTTVVLARGDYVSPPLTVPAEVTLHGVSPAASYVRGAVTLSGGQTRLTRLHVGSLAVRAGGATTVESVWVDGLDLQGGSVTGAAVVLGALSARGGRVALDRARIEGNQRLSLTQGAELALTESGLFAALSAQEGTRLVLERSVVERAVEARGEVWARESTFAGGARSGLIVGTGTLSASWIGSMPIAVHGRVLIRQSALEGAMGAPPVAYPLEIRGELTLEDLTSGQAPELNVAAGARLSVRRWTARSLGGASRAIESDPGSVVEIHGLTGALEGARPGLSFRGAALAEDLRLCSAMGESMRVVTASGALELRRAALVDLPCALVASEPGELRIADLSITGQVSCAEASLVVNARAIDARRVRLGAGRAGLTAVSGVLEDLAIEGPAEGGLSLEGGSAIRAKRVALSGGGQLLSVTQSELAAEDLYASSATIDSPVSVARVECSSVALTRAQLGGDAPARVLDVDPRGCTRDSSLRLTKASLAATAARALSLGRGPALLEHVALSGAAAGVVIGSGASLSLHRGRLERLQAGVCVEDGGEMEALSEVRSVDVGLLALRATEAMPCPQ